MNNQKDKRRRELAKYIGSMFHQCEKLVPGDVFGLYPMDRANAWIGEEAMDIAWWIAASRIASLSNSHVIDHAWFVRYDGRPNESWALVTEPYIEKTEAEKLALLAQGEMEGWELRIRVLPAEMGSWNHNGCLPIVITYTEGFASWFCRKSLLWALTNGPLSWDHG